LLAYESLREVVKALDIIINLYNECRRYCMYNGAFWDRQASELGEKFRYRYSKTKEFILYQAEEASNTSFREEILKVILNEIEKIIPENFKTIEDLKEYIIYTSENA